ncbi:MAG: NAD(P)H-binding protein [Hamadaea sp.]|nr:NAD(P)H-binding protein [Hamadaea sp.]
MTTLIIGATGNVGRHLTASLARTELPVRALTRRPDAAGFPAGVQAVGGDLTDPESLRVALDGVDSVFLLWPFRSAEGAAPVIETIAKYARKVVYLSAFSVRDDVSPAENGVWGEIEDLIRRSGVDWTFLRAGGFATNTLGWAGQIRTGDVVRAPYAGAQRSLIHEADLAAVAVVALTEAGHTGQSYILTGPATVSQADQVRIIGETIGRPLRFEEQPPEEARAQMLAMWGNAEFVDRALAHWASIVTEPEPVVDTVEQLTGRPARTFADWAADHAADFRSTGDVAEAYVGALRRGALAETMPLLAPDMVRVAPLEGVAEVAGLEEIMANAQRLTADYEIHEVTADGPFLGDGAGEQFAVKFTFDQTHKPSGVRRSARKLTLYTVQGGRIVREEVAYVDAPSA